MVFVKILTIVVVFAMVSTNLVLLDFLKIAPFWIASRPQRFFNLARQMIPALPSNSPT